MEIKLVKILLIILLSSILIFTCLSAVANTNIMNFVRDNYEPIINDDILDQSQEVFDTICIFGTIPTYYHFDWYAFQSFIPQTGKLTRVEIFLSKYREDPAVKNANLAIRENLYGENLTMASVSHTQIPPYGDPEWIEFDFPDIQVKVGQTYYIVCSSDWYPVVDSIYAWGCGEDNPYTSGSSGYSNDAGQNWDFYDNSDFCFRTYGTTPDLEISNIKGGVGKVSAEITNNLDQIIEDIDCTITVNGGIFNQINVVSEITIDSLNIGESRKISSDGFIFGLGPIDIEITATCNDVGEVTEVENGWVILFLVL